MCGATSVTWMLMPGETRAGAAASFALMWGAMMVPMMAPSLAPALWRYRRSLVRAGAAHRPALTTLAGAGYFFVWTLLGLAAYPLAALFADAGSRLVMGAVVVGGGLMQFSAWKQRQLACCRDDAGCSTAHPPSAWLHGMQLGARCALCCGNLTMIVLVAGAMNFVVMAAVTAAITLERVLPSGARVARGLGVVVVGAGLCVLARALGAP